MRAYERLLRYAVVPTASQEETGTNPSTQSQFVLARLLEEEMRGLGLQDVELTDTCYVYGRLPATAGCEDAPRLGLIAHMDTSPDFSGEGVRPQIIENFDGRDMPLGDSGRVLTSAMFPHLPSLKGRTLITTDGTTLLGADDKAGIAEILTLIEELQAEGTAHGTISVCFTPDEEVGCGASNFDIPRLGADFGYTLDGGPEGEIEAENFNACAATLLFSGVNVHPGSAKDIMVNASLVAMEFNSMLPSGDTPRDTQGREGFFHITGMAGTGEKAQVTYIVRDHDAACYEMRRNMMRHAAELINRKYGAGTVTLILRDQYRNMAEKIFPENAHLVENAEKATIMAGVTPRVVPIRGGTDGAQLSWEGLPCPNLGTGGYAFHGPYEHVTVEGMDKCVEILKNIVGLYALKKAEV